ncbi:hypothetical protein MTO96_051399 [Rhipicephalus appendiculatus]
MTAQDLDACFRFVSQATEPMLCTLDMLDYPWLPGPGGYKEIELVQHMASALRVLGHRTTFMVTDALTTVQGCILVEDPEPGAPVHVICVCFWRRLPYMAVYAPNEKIHSDLSILLAAVLDCDPMRQVRGIYDDLNSAETKALYDAMHFSYGSKPVERSLRDMT